MDGGFGLCRSVGMKGERARCIQACVAWAGKGIVSVLRDGVIERKGQAQREREREGERGHCYLLRFHEKKGGGG